MTYPFDGLFKKNSVYYIVFERIQTANEANAWMTSGKKRDKEDFEAIRLWMSVRSCLWLKNKFRYIFEFDKETETITKAQIKPDTAINWKSVVKKRGYLYEAAYDEETAKRIFLKI